MRRAPGNRARAAPAPCRNRRRCRRMSNRPDRHRAPAIRAPAPPCRRDPIGRPCRPPPRRGRTAAGPAARRHAPSRQPPAQTACGSHASRRTHRCGGSTPARGTGGSDSHARRGSRRRRSRHRWRASRHRGTRRARRGCRRGPSRSAPGSRGAPATGSVQGRATAACRPAHRVHRARAIPASRHAIRRCGRNDRAGSPAPRPSP